MHLHHNKDKYCVTHISIKIHKKDPRKSVNPLAETIPHAGAGILPVSRCTHLFTLFHRSHTSGG